MLPTLARSLAVYGGAAATIVVRRAASSLCLYLLVAVLVLAGLAFMTTAAVLALSGALGAIYATLIVGSIYLLLALIAALAVRAR